MRDKKEFLALLKSLQGQPPRSLQTLFGEFDFTRFVLQLRRDAATDSESGNLLLVLHVPQLIAGFPSSLFNTPIRRTALEDLLARKIAAVIDAVAQEDQINIARPGPQILPRSSVIVAQDFLEARLHCRIPIVNGGVDARSADALFFHHLPAIVNEAMIYCYHDPKELLQFIWSMEDSDAIRQSLSKRGLVGFVGGGALLPGTSNALSVDDATAIQIEAPNAKALRGMGIPAGVTVIVGDPFSGRRELIRALAAGIYNHEPSSGRSHVITVSDAVAVESEPGRPVQRADISAFLADRPGHCTTDFSTPHATAVESQMASVAEAVEAGSRVLIFDEDTSTPAFLSADVGMLSNGGESPRLMPLASRARQIADQWRVSVIVGACACAADFVGVADAVWMIEDGRLRDITADAKKKLGSPAPALPLSPLPAAGGSPRLIIPSSIDPSLGQEDALIQAHGTGGLTFGRSRIRLHAVPQLAEESQVEAIGLLLYYVKLHYLDEARPLTDLLDELDKDLASEGLDSITRDMRGDLARARRFEIAAALNRLSTLRVARPGK